MISMLPSAMLWSYRTTFSDNLTTEDEGMELTSKTSGDPARSLHAYRCYRLRAQQHQQYQQVSPYKVKPLNNLPESKPFKTFS